MSDLEIWPHCPVCGCPYTETQDGLFCAQCDLTVDGDYYEDDNDYWQENDEDDPITERS
jgi:uncharacterized Zn finger protein (UPF0148 family)